MDDININNVKNKTRLLFLRKIKISKNQNMHNKLKQFFWNVDKYFQKNYDKYDILVGNKHNNNKKDLIYPSMLAKQNKKKIKKASTMSMNINFQSHSHSHDRKNINESRITINSQSSKFDRKRGLLKNSKEGLKVGQKYITESELEDLFNAFSVVHKINQKKSNDFIMAKDYIDNNILIANKTFSNFGKFNENKKNPITGINNILPVASSLNNYKTLASQRTNISNNDIMKTISTVPSINYLKESKDDSKNDFIYYNIAQTLKEKIIKKDSLSVKMKEEFKENKKYKTLTNFFTKNKLFENQKLIKRNKLIKRQNQYLSARKEKEKAGIEINKAINDYYANLLADQEQVILNTEKNKLKKNKITKALSKLTKKSENNLLLKDIESFRVCNELKDKFCNLGTKLEPEHNYCWKKDLRGDLYIIKRNENNPNYFNIRDPFNKIVNGSFSDKNLTKKKYLKYYKNILEENNNINKNLEGLYINGKNLLKQEYEQFKSIKNRKILNNYEMYLPSAEVEDIIFVDKKYSKK